MDIDGRCRQNAPLFKLGIVKPLETREVPRQSGALNGRNKFENVANILFIEVESVCLLSNGKLSNLCVLVN